MLYDKYNKEVIVNSDIIKDNIRKYINFHKIPVDWISNIIEKPSTDIGDFLNSKSENFNMLCEIVNVFGFKVHELVSTSFEKDFCSTEKISNSSKDDFLRKIALIDNEMGAIKDIITLMDIINAFKVSNASIV